MSYVQAGYECIPVLACVTIVGDEADDGLSMVSTGFYPTQEETLGPLQRLQKFWDSDNVFNRQMVARNLLDTLRAVVTNREELEEGLKVLVSLSEDVEPMVRSELMEQIPHLALFCSEYREFFPNTIQEVVLPTVVRYLTDGNNQVRKTSQAALLVLLEQELISHGDMVDQVCPVIIQLSSQESSDDYRTEAVALMSKVSPLAGREITERFFLPHFTVLCKDSHFHLRKVCAANIGDICNVVGQESTQGELLPRFEALCQDGVWGVRKACAECFMRVSYAVSSGVRKERLSPLFVQLLCDQSRWVRMAAFQNLGPFISTFADPSISGVQLIYNPDGTVHIRMVDPEDGLHLSLTDHSMDSGSPNSLSPTDTFEIQQETSDSSHHHGNGSSSCDPNKLPTNVHSSTKTTEESPTHTSLPDSHTISQTGEHLLSMMAKHHVYSGTNAVSFMPSGHNPPTPVVESTPSSTGAMTPLEGAPPGEGEQIQGGSGSGVTAPGMVVGTTSPEEAEYNTFQFWRSPVAVVGGKEKENSSRFEAEARMPSPASGHDGSLGSGPAPNSNTQVVAGPIEEDNGSLDKVQDSRQIISYESPAAAVAASPSQIVSSATFNLSRPQEEGSQEDEGESSHSYDDTVVMSSNDGDKVSPPSITESGDDMEVVSNNDKDEGEKGDDDKEQSKPEVSVEADKGIGQSEGGPQDQSSEGLPTRLEGMQLSDPSAGEDRQPTVGETMNSHTALQSAGVNVHRAEIGQAVDESETATNIGTTRVIGAQLGRGIEFVNGWPGNNGAPQPMEVSPRGVEQEEQDENQSRHGLTQFQNVIPEQLLEQYLSMTDPTRAQTVDTDIAKHCAYSLPGVALTLGRHNWPCLKEVYDTLASDMQWKVRRTLAFSIHEMALILGDEITSLDLVPIFNGFLKDLDEVRIGVLKHFADFVKLLRPQLRQQYLNRMNDFLTTDNQRNWRFRFELAEQLIDMCDFYSPIEVYDNILHIAIELACDRVADVRFMAYGLISRVLRIVGASAEKELTNGVKEQLQNKFAQSQKWFERQAYVHICQKFLEEQALDADQFATDFLPSMLDLSVDPIPNVRITLARTLAQSVMPLVYFTTDDNPLHERLIAVLSQLANDEDMDVGYYSRLAPIGETTIPDEEPPV